MNSLEKQVEQLAADHMKGDDAARRADGSYLRILVAAVQERFTNRSRARKQAVGQFLATTHTALYPAILRGITTPEVADDAKLNDDERRQRADARNGRAGFARSSASTLQMYIRAGGNVVTLDINTVSKTALRKWTVEARGERAPSVVVLAALKRVERDATQLLAQDPDEGRLAVAACIERLQAMLDNTGDGAPAQVIRLPRKPPQRAFRPRATNGHPQPAMVN